jgi:hypothetical protein
MNMADFFKQVIKTLHASHVDFALAGGLVASLYRETERTTNDLDFLILGGKESAKIATDIIKQLALEPHVIRKADLEGGPLFAIKRKSTPPYMIAGRSKDMIGLDFILPAIPWFGDALARAKFNAIDFGFGPVPCLTKEDVVVSKLYSLRNDPTRFNDLDDLKSIFKAQSQIDIAYICGQMQKLELSVPNSLKEIAPKPMLLTSKRVRRKLK